MLLEKETIEKIAQLHEEYMKKHSDDEDLVLGSEKSFDKMEKYYSDPLRAELEKVINELSKEEKDELMALMYFGREDDYKNQKDFEGMKKKVSYDGEYDTDHMISKVPFAEYLRTGLKKLNK